MEPLRGRPGGGRPFGGGGGGDRGELGSGRVRGNGYSGSQRLPRQERGILGS